MMGVELRNAQRRIRLDSGRFKQVAEKLLEAVGRSESELSILLTDDRRMAKLHERWMGEPGPTDVLSFPMRDVIASDRESKPCRERSNLVLKTRLLRRPCGPPRNDESERPQLLGDIAISVETARRRGKGKLFEEMTRYLIHGLLHLIGHDHATKRERQGMNRQARRLWREVVDGMA